MDKKEDEKPQETSKDEKAVLVAEKVKSLKESNEELEQQIARREELLARASISGKAEAGQVIKPKEESPKEYMERVLRGGK